MTGWEQELRSKSSSQVRPRTYSYTSPTLASRAGVNSGSVRERTTAARTTPTTGSASWTPNLAIKGVAPATTVPTSVPSSFNNVSPRIQAGYGVQLASYANYDNADKRQRTVYSQGVTNVFIKQGVSKSGAQVFRVVVGPFSDQQTASQSLQQIKRTYALKGFVVNLQK